MKIYKHLLFLVTMFCASIATAQTAGELSPQHLQAAERLIYAMGMPESFSIPTKKMLEQSMLKDPANAALMSASFAPYLERKYMADQLKGHFARQFDVPTARTITEFWEGPVGKKLVRAQMRMLDNGEAPALVFSAKEKAIVKRFESTEAFKVFASAMPGIQDELGEVTRKTHMRMRETFLTNLENQSKGAKTK